MIREHTDREYESELKKLREQILLMGAKVEAGLSQSMKALVERNSTLAHSVIKADNEIDDLEVAIDDHCMRILAKRQPVASDLRFITIALKIVTDLERIGDLSVNLCERAIELNAETPLKPYIDLPKMSEAVQGMIRDSLDAFVAGNAERAQEILCRDSFVDALYAQIFRELLTYMMEDTKTIHRAIKVQAIAKYLERIGDHAVNLAEMVVFMARGKDIRHTGRHKPECARPHGVLFLCVENCARSQMAEGLARVMFPAGVRIFSAGSNPGQVVDPRAVSVLRENGIDISAFRPKGVQEIPLGDFDTVIKLCSEEQCPFLPGDHHTESWNLPDPRSPKNAPDNLDAFREIRDHIKQRLQDMVASWR